MSSVLGKLLKLAMCVLCLCLTAVMLLLLCTGSGRARRYDYSGELELDAGAQFDRIVFDAYDAATQTVLNVKKKYWLMDEDKIAPAPNPEKRGTTKDPASLGWLLEEASELLDGQDTLFQTDTNIAPGSTIHYYLDETIMSITWKQGFGDTMYSITEVKIADPSQFRRYLAGEKYDSNLFFYTTTMSAKTNAVVAISGDFYTFRPAGISVYEGVVRKPNGEYLDTCYIDKNGDMVFSYGGDLVGRKAIQEFVDENDIRFSVSFGPVLFENGKRVYTYEYLVGEINDTYARAALAQRDELHYLLITANAEHPYYMTITLNELASAVEKMGVKHAYTLDGGQTAAMAVGGKLINKVALGKQRPISDILYFATAIPEIGEGVE